jgi:hypothetical protein
MECRDLDGCSGSRPVPCEPECGRGGPGAHRVSLELDLTIFFRVGFSPPLFLFRTHEERWAEAHPMEPSGTGIAHAHHPSQPSP